MIIYKKRKCKVQKSDKQSRRFHIYTINSAVPYSTSLYQSRTLTLTWIRSGDGSGIHGNTLKVVMATLFVLLQ